MKIKCNICGTAVSNEVPDTTIIMAHVECPECIKVRWEIEAEINENNS